MRLTVPDAYFRRGKRGGWTYFVQATIGGPIKIGSTLGHPTLRLRALQSCCPFPLRIIGLAKGINVEADLHERFADYRLHGEWFDEAIAGDLPITHRLPEEAP